MEDGEIRSVTLGCRHSGRTSNFVSSFTGIVMRPSSLGPLFDHSRVGLTTKTHPCVHLCRSHVPICFCALSVYRQPLHQVRIRSCSRRILLFGSTRIRDSSKACKDRCMMYYNPGILDLSTQLVYCASRNVTIFATMVYGEPVFDTKASDCQKPCFRAASSQTASNCRCYGRDAL